MGDPLSAVRYFTTAEVAERYRASDGTVRYWRHIGYGPRGVKIGRRVLYTEAALAEFDAELAANVASDPRGAA